jgi:hypothetical protein
MFGDDEFNVNGEPIDKDKTISFLSRPNKSVYQIPKYEFGESMLTNRGNYFQIFGIEVWGITFKD